MARSYASNNDVCTLDSDGEVVPKESGRKRKRGRPPASEISMEPIGERLLSVEQEGSNLSRSDRKAQESIEDYLEEFRSVPTPDLGAIIIEEMAKVWQMSKMSKVSRGLKGELSGALKKASCRTRAAVQALLSRGPSNEGAGREMWRRSSSSCQSKGGEQGGQPVKGKTGKGQQAARGAEKEVTDLKEDLRVRAGGWESPIGGRSRGERRTLPLPPSTQDEEGQEA